MKKIWKLLLLQVLPPLLVPTIGESPSLFDYSIKTKELPKYLSSIVELRSKYPSLEIVSGLEADWYPGCEADLRAIRADLNSKKDYHPTFLLGSIHFLQEKPLDWDEYMEIWDELAQTHCGASTKRNGALLPQVVCSTQWHTPICPTS